MKVGIVTYVNGWYYDYIPLFVHAARRAYPDYEIRIACDRCPHYDVQADLIEFPNPHPRADKPYYLRWLLPESIFVGLDYAFIGDVDLLMFRESPTLAEVRLAVMAKTGRPYANFLRKPAENHPERYTGWHFIEVKPYYERIAPFANEVFHDANFDISTPPSYGYYKFGEFQWGQEHLLYRLIERAFGVDREKEIEYKLAFANHHGVHLGPLRSGMRLEDVSSRLPRNDKFWLDGDRVRELLLSAEFGQLVAQVREERIMTVMTRLYAAYGVEWPSGEPA